MPTGALFVGGPGRDYGQFYHHNSVDEIIIAFVARDATLQTGQLYNGGRVHGVNSFLKDQTKAGAYALFTVTQRQNEITAGDQPEAVSMLCKGCRKQLFLAEFDSLSPPDSHEVDKAFHTLVGASDAMQRFNDNPELRKCKECGHENDPFPLHMWGWHDYRDSLFGHGERQAGVDRRRGERERGRSVIHAVAAQEDLHRVQGGRQARPLRRAADAAG